MQGWDLVKHDKTVWKPKGHPDVSFEKMAVQVAWENILGKSMLESSQYKEADGN